MRTSVKLSRFNPRIKNDVSVVETVSIIKVDPTFASVPSIFSVPSMTGQTSSDDDVSLNNLSHKKGAKSKKKGKKADKDYNP